MIWPAVPPVMVLEVTLAVRVMEKMPQEPALNVGVALKDKAHWLTIGPLAVSLAKTSPRVTGAGKAGVPLLN